MIITMDIEGCTNLKQEMETNIKQLSQLVSSIEENNLTLNRAFGEDSQAILKNMATVKSELESAKQNLETVINGMMEYINIQHQIKIVVRGE